MLFMADLDVYDGKITVCHNESEWGIFLGDLKAEIVAYSFVNL